jgi:hypothetical protein
MLQIPRGAEREYLTILGVAAIYGVELPIGSGFLGVSRDLNLSLHSLRRRWCGAEIGFCFWVKDRSTAETIRHLANAMMQSGASVAAMRDAIGHAAERCGVILTEHDVVMLRVSAVVRMVEAKIDEASQNGELQWFNRAFRQWRLEARSCGRVMTYSEARARLRRAVIKYGLSELTFSEWLLAAVFPGLKSSPTLNFRLTADSTGALFTRAGAPRIMSGSLPANPEPS